MLCRVADWAPHECLADALLWPRILYRVACPSCSNHWNYCCPSCCSDRFECPVNWGKSTNAACSWLLQVFGLEKSLLAEKDALVMEDHCFLWSSQNCNQMSWKRAPVTRSDYANSVSSVAGFAFKIAASSTRTGTLGPLFIVIASAEAPVKIKLSKNGVSSVSNDARLAITH